MGKELKIVLLELARVKIMPVKVPVAAKSSLKHITPITPIIESPKPDQKRLLFTNALSSAKNINEKLAIQIRDDFANKTIKAGPI